MTKRGNAELLIFLAVAVTALGGVVFYLLPNNPTTGQAVIQMEPSQFVGRSTAVENTEPAFTGHFVLPAVKEYGGDVSGVSAPGTRAFPAGRAAELPDQSCYTCNCMEQGITSATKEAAERVCTDNCGGEIVSIVVGEC